MQLALTESDTSPKSDQDPRNASLTTKYPKEPRPRRRKDTYSWARSARFFQYQVLNTSEDDSSAYEFDVNYSSSLPLSRCSIADIIGSSLSCTPSVAVLAPK